MSDSENDQVNALMNADNVSDVVPPSEAPATVEEVSEVEAPAEEAPVEEAPVEEAPVEEAHVEEAPAVEAPVEEAPAVEVPVSTQEVVQNVQEMLTTEPAVSSDSARLEERVKVLEERLESLVNVLKEYEPRIQRLRNLVSDI